MSRERPPLRKGYSLRLPYVRNLRIEPPPGLFGEDRQLFQPAEKPRSCLFSDANHFVHNDDDFKLVNNKSCMYGSYRTEGFSCPQDTAVAAHFRGLSPSGCGRQRKVVRILFLCNIAAEPYRICFTVRKPYGPKHPRPPFRAALPSHDGSELYFCMPKIFSAYKNVRPRGGRPAGSEVANS